MTTATTVRTAALADLDARMLHDLVRLRIDVFVVEQECPYPELDGLDAEPTTRHLWTADDRGPTAYLRVLDDGPGLLRIGRVCTRADARGGGLAAQLMSAALVVAEDEDQEVVLSAQSYLCDWYERFGFTVDGAEFVEDGIPHTPMRRPRSPDD